MPLITQAARMLEIVARSGSIRKASERVNCASSAVNRQILNLEAEYGTPLFTRHPRGMRLTEAGKIVVEQVRLWQSDDHALRDQIEVLKGQSGHLSIGIMECLASAFLPALNQKIQEVGGTVALDVKVGGTQQVARQLSAGELDLAITFNMPSEFGFKTLYETKVELGAVMRPNHDLVQVNPIPRSELNKYPLILADQSLSISPVVQSMLAQSGMSTAAIAKSNSVTVIKSLISQSDAITFLTLVDVHSELENNQLHFGRVERTNTHEVLSVCALDGTHMTPTAKLVAQLAGKQLDEIGIGVLSRR